MTVLDHVFDAYDKLQGMILKPVSGGQDTNNHHWALRLIVLFLVLLILFQVVFGFLWNDEPDSFRVVENAASLSSRFDEDMVTGYITISTLITTAETLLDKPGGYLSNDMLPPGVFMDNIPNWEFGALSQIRDMTLAIRNDISRSQSQSVEDQDVIVAENQFRIDSESWLLPSAEGEYRKGIDALYRYLHRLTDNNAADAQFYARADNLSDWLALVEKRLGSLSQRLSASVGQERLNTDLAGDAQAHQSTPGAKVIDIKTPWMEIDDIFYEARGSAWVLSQLFKAVEVDFQDILQKKNALVSLRQITRELDATQSTVWSPVILNGGGFGFFANHSLVMANYISRANAAVIDLRTLLAQG